MPRRRVAPGVCLRASGFIVLTWVLSSSSSHAQGPDRTESDAPVEAALRPLHAEHARQGAEQGAVGVVAPAEQDLDVTPETHAAVDPAPLDDGFGASAVVDATPAARGPSSASDHDISVGALRSVPRRSAEEMLTLAPGITLANHAGEGHASGLYLRGFDAGEGQDVEVLVDGLPLNEPSNAHEHGYADSHFLIPELVRALRVVAGPFDPAQGDFALAGSIEYRLGSAPRGLHVIGGYGSFQRHRAVVLYGDGEDSFAGFEYQAGRGFGVNRAHRNLRAIARYTGGDARLRWSLTGASHALDFDSAGVLRDDLLPSVTCDEPFYCTLDPQQGGSAQRHLVSASIEAQRPWQRWRQRALVQARSTRFRENFTGTLVDERGDGLDQRTSALTFGLFGDYLAERRRPNDTLQLELGYAGRHDRGETTMSRLRRDGGIPYARVFDSELALTHLAAYASGRLKVPRLELRGGARLAGYAFSVVSRNEPMADRMGERLPEQTKDAFGLVLLPRLTATVELAPELHWITSLGRGARASDAQALSEGERAPFAVARSLETGLALEAEYGSASVGASASAFWTHVDRDLLFDPVAGRNILVGATQRIGAAATARLRYGDWLDVLGSLSWTEAHLPPDDAGPFEIVSGRRLPFVPRYVGRIDASVDRAFRARGESIRYGLALGLGIIGRRPLPLEQLSARVLTLDASLRIGWRHLELALLGKNLTNAQNRVTELFYESSFDSGSGFPSLRAAHHFAAGPPLELMAQLTLHLDVHDFVGDDP